MPARSLSPNLTQANPIFVAPQRCGGFLYFAIGSRCVIFELSRVEMRQLGTQLLKLDKFTLDTIREAAAFFILNSPDINGPAFLIYPTSDTTDDEACYNFKVYEFLNCVAGIDVNDNLLQRLDLMCQGFGV